MNSYLMDEYENEMEQFEIATGEAMRLLIQIQGIDEAITTRSVSQAQSTMEVHLWQGILKAVYAAGVEAGKHA